MGRTDDKDERQARLAGRLRDNLRRRKAQARERTDLSGLDPNRTDTPLQRHKDNDKGEDPAG